MQPVTISIDAQNETGPLDRVWRCIGYNEINWTYTPIGKQVLRAIQELGDGAFSVRVMGAFSSGNRRSYAHRHGYTYCEFDAPLVAHRSFGFHKLVALRHLLSSATTPTPQALCSYSGRYRPNGLGLKTLTTHHSSVGSINRGPSITSKVGQ